MSTSTKEQRRSFGRRLTKARESKGLSLSAFAREVDVEPPTALGWERGQYMPSAYRLPKIALVLGVRTDDLLIAAGKAAPEAA